MVWQDVLFMLALWIAGCWIATGYHRPSLFVKVSLRRVRGVSVLRFARGDLGVGP